MYIPIHINTRALTLQNFPIYSYVVTSQYWLCRIYVRESTCMYPPPHMYPPPCTRWTPGDWLCRICVRESTCILLLTDFAESVSGNQHVSSSSLTLPNLCQGINMYPPPHWLCRICVRESTCILLLTDFAESVSGNQHADPQPDESTLCLSRQPGPNHI